MDEQTVRDDAQALADALVAGNVDLAIAHFSDALRHNLGEVLALLPLPASAATIESIEHGGPSYTVVLRLVGESEEVMVQTRWKERDGQPTVIEASHLSRVAIPAAAAGTEGAADAETAGAGPAGE